MGVTLWAKRRFGIDLTTREACLARLESDLEKVRELKAQWIAAAESLQGALTAEAKTSTSASKEKARGSKSKGKAAKTSTKVQKRKASETSVRAEKRLKKTIVMDSDEDELRIRGDKESMC
jgi:hypothetical protein